MCVDGDGALLCSMNEPRPIDADPFHALPVRG
jgi:hypothetical protein